MHLSNGPYAPASCTHGSRKNVCVFPCVVMCSHTGPGTPESSGGGPVFREPRAVAIGMPCLGVGLHGMQFGDVGAADGAMHWVKLLRPLRLLRRHAATCSHQCLRRALMCRCVHALEKVVAEGAPRPPDRPICTVDRDPALAL